MAAKRRGSNIILWIIALLVALGLIGAVVTLGVKLNRQTTIDTVGGEAYSIGVIDENGAIDKTADTAIYTRKLVTTDGLDFAYKGDDTVTLTVFYYDADEKFVSSESYECSKESNTISATTTPEGAEYARFMITPEEDEDGKVTMTEVLGYAANVKITYNK
jgi:hypothetical protein